MVLYLKKKRLAVEPQLPTNRLGNPVADAEDGQAPAQELATANADNASGRLEQVDLGEGSNNPQDDGFTSQELNVVHDD